MKLSERYPALASRDFSIFWIGQFISLIGTWMQNTTQPYLAYRLTGSSLDLGIIGQETTGAEIKLNGETYVTRTALQGLVVQEMAPASMARRASATVGLLIQSRVGVSAATRWK